MSKPQTMSNLQTMPTPTENQVQQVSNTSITTQISIAKRKRVSDDAQVTKKSRFGHQVNKRLQLGQIVDQHFELDNCPQMRVMHRGHISMLMHNAVCVSHAGKTTMYIIGQAPREINLADVIAVPAIVSDDACPATFEDWFSTRCTKTPCDEHCRNKNHKGCPRAIKIQISRKAPHSWLKYCKQFNLPEKDLLSGAFKIDFEEKFKQEMGLLFHESTGHGRKHCYDHVRFHCCSNDNCQCDKASNKKLAPSNA